MPFALDSYMFACCVARRLERILGIKIPILKPGSPIPENGLLLWAERYGSVPNSLHGCRVVLLNAGPHDKARSEAERLAEQLTNPHVAA